MSLGAVVICGGESRRMGCSKAWLPFGPERMLQRVVRLVGNTAREIVVVAASGQELPPSAAAITIVRDPVPGRGPLQGLATGFAALSRSVNLVYATATDVPFLEPLWIIRLTELIGDHDLAIPFIGEHFHPLAALYRKDTVVSAMEGLLREDRLRVSSIVDEVRTRVVSEVEMRNVDPALGTIRNLNRPEDYKQALREAGLSGE